VSFRVRLVSSGQIWKGLLGEYRKHESENQGARDRDK